MDNYNKIKEQYYQMYSGIRQSANAQTQNQGVNLGSMQSSRDVLKAIGEASVKNSAQGDYLYSQWVQEQSNPYSQYYNKYIQPTNRAAEYLAKNGFNTDLLTNGWLDSTEAQGYIQSNLVYDGATNTPKTPGKKSTADQVNAYWLNQYMLAEPKTQEVQKEIDDAVNTAYYLAQRSDLNYSDDQIIDMIYGYDDANLQKKYPTLYKMKTDKTSTLELNSGFNFSEDTLRGAIWAARNNGGTGNPEVDAIMSAMGSGKSWEENPEISAALNPYDADGNVNGKYNPYSVGSTVQHDDLQFFGLNSVPEGWVEENKWMRVSGTPEQKKHYENVYAAEQNWQSGKTAVDTLYDYLNTFVSDGKSADKVIEKLDDVLTKGKIYVKTDANGKTRYSASARNGYEAVDLSILNKIDASVGKNGSDPVPSKLVPMTRGLNYKYDNMVNQIRETCAANDAARKTEAGTSNSIVDDAEKDAAVAASSVAEGQIPTGTEEIDAVSGADTVQDRLKNSDFQKTQTGTKGKSPQTQGTAIDKSTGEIVRWSETDLKAIDEKNEKISEAAETAGDALSDNEKTVFKFGASVIFNQSKRNFSLMRGAKKLMQSLTNKAVDMASVNFLDTGLNTVHDIVDYRALVAENAADKDRVAELETMYGNMDLLGKEFEPRIDVQIGDFTVSLNAVQAPEYGKYRYEIANITSPGRNILNSDELLNYDFGSEVFAQARAVANQKTVEANSILAAHRNAEKQNSDWQKDLKEYNLLVGRIDEQDAEIKERAEKTAEEESELAKYAQKLNMMRESAIIQGLDTSRIDEAWDFMTGMLDYYYEPQLPVNNQTKLGYLNDLAATTGKEYTTDQKSELLHDGVDKIDAEIKKINDEYAYAEKTGYKIPARYDQNMQYKLQDLQNERKMLEYSIILTDTDPDELAAAIQAGKDFEKKYADSMQTFQALYATEEEGFSPEYFFTLGEKQAATANDEGTWFSFVTDEDKDIYYYLLGKKIQENGEAFDKLWEDNAMSLEAKNLLTDIMKDADDYVEFMNDKEYGAWVTQRAESTRKHTEEMVNSGFGGGLLVNLASTLITPFESLANAGGAIDQVINGGRINPNAPYRLASIYKESTREATFASIDEVYKDNPTARWFARLGYEIYTNRGDSLMNSMFFGALMPNASSAILNELLGAAPMGLTAATNAAAEAVENGASTEQAWWVFGWTFAAETLTEAITYSNIREAVGVTEELSKETLKQFAVDWLTKSGVEEMIGESTNDVVENWANRASTEIFDNPNYESDHQKLIDQFYAEGYTGPGEAEAKAYEEEVKGIVHTAFVSYISAGADVLLKTGKAAVNKVQNAADIVNGYRVYTKGRQKIGYGDSILDYMKKDLKDRKGGFKTTAPTTNTQAPTQEASAAAPSETVNAEAETANVDLNAAYETARLEYDSAYKNERQKRKDLNRARKDLTEAQKSGNQERISEAKAFVDASQQEYNNAKQAKEEARTRRNEAGTALEKAEQARVAEAATPEQKQAAADVAAVERVSESTPTTQTEMIASMLDNGDGDGAVTDQANAAAVYLKDLLGEDYSYFVQQVMLGQARTGVSREVITTALMNAALGNGAATALVQSEEFRNAPIEAKAQMLAATIEQDQNSAEVQQSIADKVKDYRISIGMSEQAANGHFNQATESRNAANKAAAKTAEAQTQLEEKQDASKATQEDFETKDNEFQRNPQDANLLKERQDALNRRDRADESQHQYEQHLDNVAEEQKEAEAKADKDAAEAATTARDIAQENMNQQDQQRADQAAMVAEQQRQQEEADRQAQAEEDQRTGKAQEDEDNAKIDALVDSSSLTDEEKETLKKQLKDRNAKRRQGKINLNGKLTDAESMLALGAFQRKLGVPILFSDEIGAADGLYDPTKGVIYLNARKAQDGSMRLGRALLEVAMHEITHSLEQTKHYQQYRKIVLNALFGEGKNFDQAAYDLEIKQKQDLYKKNGEELTPEQAEKEIIADFAKKRLSEKDIVQRFMDAGMGGKMRNMLHNINQALKNFFGNMSGEDREVAENLRKAERAFQKAMNERAKTQVHPGAEQFSISQFAQATGMTYNEKTQTLYNANNEPIDGVTEGRKVTPEMIRQTPVGKLIDMGLENDQKQAALDMFSGLMNMIAMLKDNNLVWEIAGGTLESTFSALKANSDTQYHDTIDFGTICAKTQAIVNVMSEVMLDRLKANDIARKEGRYDDVSYGLTRDDVLKIYDETYKAGLSVPCPVCYVFSHWMGVPSLLGQMSRFQHDYIVTGKDANGNDIHYGDGDIVLDENGYATFDPVETEKAARAYIEKMHGLYGDKEGVDARKTKINSEINKGEKRHTKLESDIEKLNNQLKNENLNKRSREAAEKKLAAAKAELEQNAINISALDEELREVEAYNWITQSLMTTNENGEYVIDPDFKITPDEVLLDMRRTGEFADRYDKNWAYRTSRGAGMGKSILPYSGASLGDIIMGNQTRVALTDNPLFNDNEENTGTAKAIESARNRARRQNLIGGQRLQSTSDFRPEWGLDYIMAFLELQAAKSNAQMYTKVAEAVDLFASAGADVNLSIMGSGNGFHEASAEEIAKMTDKQREAATIDGKVYVMDFSDVTGMGYGDALNKSRQYDNVQMILVGMNDTHIRLALAGDEIDFVIPWHSSGNSKDVLSQLVASVEETLNTSSDYTNTQSDKFVSRKEKYIDDETGKKKTRTVDARTDEQKTMWNARIKILTGIAQKAVNTEDSSKGGLTEAEKKYVIGKDANPYLKDLYERFYLKEGDKCYGVALTSAQAKQIFPYEYWQTDVTKPGGTKDTADENGRRFIEYCQAMGVVPRFSGVWDAKNKTVKNGNFAGAVYDSNGKITGYDPSKMQKGYWKLLIDRKMYGLDGNYREQKQIDVSGIKIGELEGEGREAHLTKYNAETGEGSMLPTETSAKYGIPALERRAAEASERLIRKPFDLTGTQKLYSSDFSEAEMDDMLRMAGVDYQDAVARGDMKAAQEDVDFAAEQHGFTTEDAFHGTPEQNFTEFDFDISDNKIFVSYTKSLSQSYVLNNEDVRQIKDIKRDNQGALITKLKHMTPEEQISYITDDLAEQFAENGFSITDSRINKDGKAEILVTDGNDYEWTTIDNQAIYGIAELIYPEAQKNGAGLYRFYTRPGNQLVIDANGAQWNAIPFDKIDPEKGTATTREVADWAKANGYDSVRINDCLDWGGHGPEENARGDIGIFFNKEDVKSADPVTYDDNGNVIPLDQRFNDQNPDIRYSFGDQSNMTDSELDDLLRRAGVQMTQEDIDAYQEKTSRPLEGKSTKWSQEEGPAQRQFGGEGGMLQASDEIAQQAINYAMAHNAYYPDTNADQILRAINWIRKNGSTKNEDGSYTQTTDGFNESLAKVTSKSFDYRSADGQARMIATMAMAVAKNDIRAQVELADAFNRQGTDLGRALQSRKLFRMMTPSGRIASIQKLMQNYQDELDSKGYKTELSFSDWIYRAASVAESEQDFRQVQEAAADELAAQLPISWQERLRSLRMMSMLANPRTHIRNVVGNALFVPAVGLKNKIGALMELGMEKGNRTKTLRLALDKDIREFARQDAEINKADLTGDSKYDDRTLVEQSKKTLGAFQFLSDLNSNALEKEDWIFLKGHYRRALGGWMQANGYTVEQMKSNPELLEQGRAYALNEAQKATYRDFNALASWLNNPQVAGHELKGTKFVLNAVLPFKKTPANILRRGIEYSPVGIARGLWNLARGMNNGTMTANQVIDKISSGLSGTAVMALGYLLAGTGAVTCGIDDDDWLEEVKGNQKYSINVNKLLNSIGIPKLFDRDVTYTIDWAAPMAMPLFVGASIRNQADAEGWDLQKGLDALASISEPVFNLSMLDGVNSLLKTNSYSNKNAYTQIGAKILANYFGSYVPSAVGALARTIDDTQRKAYVEKDDKKLFDGTFNYAWEQAKNKLPGISQNSIPVRDVWGNAKTSDTAERIIENWVSPGYIETYDQDPVIDELERLWDSTKNSGLKPEHAATSFKSNNKQYDLTAEQYDTFDRVHGETQYSMLKELVNNEQYQQMTNDEAKADIVKQIYSYANDVGKNAVDPSIRYEKKTIDDLVHDGVVSEQKTKMVDAFEKNDMDAYEDFVNVLMDEGVKESELKKPFANQYRDKYKEAYIKYEQTGEQKYEDEMDRITDILRNTGFDYDIGAWEDDAEKDEAKYGSSGSLPANGKYMASAGMSDSSFSNRTASMPERPASDNNWDQYMSDLDDYWADYDFASNDPVGQYGKGNIDMNSRKVVQNDDGSISTERSFSFWDDNEQKEILIPLIVNGEVLTEEQAIQHYYDTGEYLGKFDDWKDADEYAMMLHNRGDWYYHQ